MIFGCVGVSHRAANADVRDRVSMTPETGAAFRRRLASLGIRQSLTISTCNRCEVFFWGDDGAAEICRVAFVDTFPAAAASLSAVSGIVALTYLFRIAAGLESMILGEYQVLGQVKDAHAAALSTGHAGRELDRILRDAVTCAKRVKTELDIGAVPPSVCKAGIEHVDRVTGISGKRVLVIGSGRTGSLAAKLSARLGASVMSVCNRSPERARRLELEIGARLVDYADRYEAIAASDIVVSATASPHVVVQADRLSLVRPVTFLDLASPRDVDPAVAANPLVTLVSIDTIGELAAGDRVERERLTARGMQIVEASVESTAKWLDGLWKEWRT